MRWIVFVSVRESKIHDQSPYSAQIADRSARFTLDKAVVTAQRPSNKGSRP